MFESKPSPVQATPTLRGTTDASSPSPKPSEPKRTISFAKSSQQHRPTQMTFCAKSLPSSYARTIRTRRKRSRSSASGSYPRTGCLKGFEPATGSRINRKWVLHCQSPPHRPSTLHCRSRLDCHSLQLVPRKLLTPQTPTSMSVGFARSSSRKR